MTDTTIPQASNEEVKTQTVEELWDEVLHHAPAMGRLPDMVAALYPQEVFDNAEEYHEQMEQTRDFVRRGAMLFYQLVGHEVLNYLFEHYDRRFGAALEMVMEWVVDLENNDEEKNYSLESICGWLLGALSIESSRASAEVLDIDTLIEPGMESVVVLTTPLLYLDHLIKSVGFDSPELRRDVRTYAREFILSFAFDVFEPSVTTTIH